MASISRNTLNLKLIEQNLKEINRFLDSDKEKELDAGIKRLESLQNNRSFQEFYKTTRNTNTVKSLYDNAIKQLNTAKSLLALLQVAGLDSPEEAALSSSSSLLSSSSSPVIFEDDSSAPRPTCCKKTCTIITKTASSVVSTVGVKNCVAGVASVIAGLVGGVYLGLGFFGMYLLGKASASSAATSQDHKKNDDKSDYLLSDSRSSSSSSSSSSFEKPKKLQASRQRQTLYSANSAQDTRFCSSSSSSSSSHWLSSSSSSSSSSIHDLYSSESKMVREDQSDQASNQKMRNDASILYSLFMGSYDEDFISENLSRISPSAYFPGEENFRNIVKDLCSSNVGTREQNYKYRKENFFELLQNTITGGPLSNDYLDFITTYNQGEPSAAQLG